MTRALTALILALALAACGEDDQPKAPPMNADQKAAAAVAEKYTHAVAAKDWKTACATRTKAEQAQFAKLLGSCEQAMAKIFKGKPVEAFARVKAGPVKIVDGVAGVSMIQPGGLARTKLAAVRDHGEWRLKDIPDEQIP
jgi:hypothetical protein